MLTKERGGTRFVIIQGSADKSQLTICVTCAELLLRLDDSVGISKIFSYYLSTFLHKISRSSGLSKAICNEKLDDLSYHLLKLDAN